jgi:hypothetical protein
MSGFHEIAETWMANLHLSWVPIRARASEKGRKSETVPLKASVRHPGLGAFSPKVHFLSSRVTLVSTDIRLHMCSKHRRWLS